MNQSIFVAHSVYLLPEERKMLSSNRTTIQTVGFSVPANSNDLKTPLTEVFCRYLITTEENVNNIQIDLMPDGYKISLKDFKDFTSIKTEHHMPKCNTFIFSNTITKDGKNYDVNHQIVFKDISALERTTTCEQLGQFLKATPKLKGRK